MTEAVVMPLVLTLVAAVAIWGLVSGLGHRPGVLFAMSLAVAGAAVGLLIVADEPWGADPVIASAGLLMGFLALIGAISGVVALFENRRGGGAVALWRLGGAGGIGTGLTAVALLAN